MPLFRTYIIFLLYFCFSVNLFIPIKINMTFLLFVSVCPQEGLFTWVRISVPQYRLPGESALLRCDFELKNGSLYSLKWYKDEEEFYRYVPRAKPQINWYEVEGVHVDVSIFNNILKIVNFVRRICITLLYAKINI